MQYTLLKQLTLFVCRLYIQENLHNKKKISDLAMSNEYR